MNNTSTDNTGNLNTLSKDTKNNQTLPYYQLSKLFVMCGIVCLEFFFIHLILAIVMKGFGLQVYFFQTVICSLVVINFMYYRYSMSGNVITLNTFIQEIFTLKGKWISTLIKAGMGFLSIFCLRVILYYCHIDTSNLFSNFYTDGELDIPVVLDNLFFSVITEEIALRRSMLNTIKTYTPTSKNYLFIISGIWFGLIHFVNIGTSSFTVTYVLFQMSYGMVIGYTFGIFTEYLGIFPSIILHSMNNACAIFIPFVFSPFLLLYSILSALLLIYLSHKLLISLSL
ncbi:amino terminal protease family protein [Entamoeba histolytica HM-1:IMSS-B]|uniref:CAAX amino terminal protease family n=7 Tax=Entamoeba histolytica TaxID=5759 RepID=C4LZW9_ENTH1|nr:CAAX amino terminal protease family [Entamoeba histolytica HM-1:IMSS]EMD47873.1 CAAX amino terminal protease family protein [Entamoeba histolytica KU27]EMH72582.1 amino terminal protease family protein [Entamoeba histolytica HM-1:IMSS-B]EMS13948.1 CAAX amino terminal protease family protein [Entamoeba histolytica HM-3:IMSS]BAN39700.1 CAAX amino terminal protease family [Entamoeba histolytica]EAL49345.2 CAAX amino terminal protease family [Entamoeba histolytica HM-1:IMSS]|eukprot:XP_654731.2 CAAX amino terminal protease family [Entamoeba histolytica HM-1:IMSS]